MNSTIQAIQPQTPPLNGEMWKGALKIACAIEELTEQGYVVIGTEHSSSAIPTVQIQTCTRCAELIARGDATYYYEAGTGPSRMRKGQFHVRDVRVIWQETGH
ncbi:hypothetical protein [Paraburkholderia unamae]|uniref:Uncharacterized protein n=1 Tax=Paraburkholderia unamae TaxID=219649 RepID=A0ABX5KHV3_9BURK|nr:hypothetical protein [Paraburkholderia unamae]PVX80026.1 hypothetical protein C7402_112213 [Paraburkholderia unamae]